MFTCSNSIPSFVLATWIMGLNMNMWTCWRSKIFEILKRTILMHWTQHKNLSSLQRSVSEKWILSAKNAHFYKNTKFWGFFYTMFLILCQKHFFAMCWDAHDAKVSSGLVQSREETKTALKSLDRMLFKNRLCNTVALIWSVQPEPTIQQSVNAVKFA